MTVGTNERPPEPVAVFHGDKSKIDEFLKSNPTGDIVVYLSMNETQLLKKLVGIDQFG